MMLSFRDTRDFLLLSYDMELIEEEEFGLLSDTCSSLYLDLRNDCHHHQLHSINAKAGDLWRSENHVALTSQSLRAAIGPLQFSLRLWNLRNLTLHSGMLPCKHASRSLEIFSANTVLSHGSITLPPHQPRVFARLARWQQQVVHDVRKLDVRPVFTRIGLRSFLTFLRMISCRPGLNQRNIRGERERAH